MMRALDETRGDWLRRAACTATEVDPGVFFDPRWRSIALRVCAGCRVREECAGHAASHHEEFGVWGGTVRG